MNFLLSFELGKIRDKVEALSYCQNNDYQENVIKYGSKKKAYDISKRYFIC